MEYKGYTAKVEYDYEDNIIVGKIIGIVDSITFETSSTQEIEQEFRNAVDDYLEFCREVGKSPDKPYKGQFNVRVSPELHRGLAMKAAQNKRTLNQEAELAFEAYLATPTNSTTTIFVPIMSQNAKTSSLNKGMWSTELIDNIAQTKNNFK